MDVKKLGNVPDGGGWRYVGRDQGDRNRAATPGKPRNKHRDPKMGTAFVHTVLDDHSRVAYAEIHDDETAATATAVLRNAVAWFAERGVTTVRVLSDNGSCYRSHLWRDTCAEASASPTNGPGPTDPRPTGKSNDSTAPSNMWSSPCDRFVTTHIVSVGLGAIALTPILLRESRADLPHRHFDFAGAFSVTAESAILLVPTLTQATSDGSTSTTTLSLLAGSLALIVAFVVVELRSKAPLLPLGIFQATDAHRRERHDGCSRRCRLLGVLPAHALYAGRPPLLGRPDRGRLSGLRADRRRRVERRPVRRRACGRAQLR